MEIKNNDVVIMTFGKYKDKPVAKMPSDYIAWCLKEAALIEKNKNLKMALEDELVRRLINIPEKDRTPAINDFVAAYDKHEKCSDIDDYEFQRIVIDKLYEFIKVVVK